MGRLETKRITDMTGGNYPSRANVFYHYSGVFLMNNERNSHRTAVLLFALAVIIAIVAAVTTFERVSSSIFIAHFYLETSGVLTKRSRFWPSAATFI